MRIHVVGAVVVCMLGGVPFEAAAQFPCVKPWAIADKWIDNRDDTEPIDGVWTEDDTFEALDARGGLFPDADFYVPPALGSQSTGFSLADVGRRVWLKVIDGGSATRQSSFAVDITGAESGGDAYREAISTCDPYAPNTVFLGQELRMLKGNLHGPTQQGAIDLILQDPFAYWDRDLRRIVMTCAEDETPCGPFSPRLAAIAAFDPAHFEQSLVGTGTPQVIVTNLIGVFIEAYIDGWVLGIVAPLPGQ
ncbi:MAG TPA: hypothetical protein VM819_10050 [Vicinamibacterales bacterium]|nr:hypothetical protein [Vicinamibacterales bacterium]